MVAGGNDKVKPTRDASDCFLSPDLNLLVSTGNHHHDYQHSHLDLSMLTPNLGKNTRKANVELA